MLNDNLSHFFACKHEPERAFIIDREHYFIFIFLISIFSSIIFFVYFFIEIFSQNNIHEKNWIPIGWNQCSWSVTSVQKVWHQWKLSVVILNYDWLKDNINFCKPMTLRKMVTKILGGNFRKEFSRRGKKL